MFIKQYKPIFIDALSPIYGIEEAESFFYIALEEINGLKRTAFIMNPEAMLSESELSQWNSVLSQLQTQRPIQYIFGKAYFYGLEFIVNENTLIPRPETEELVEWVIHENKKRTGIKILDIGTGSGCIAISLAKNLPDATVYAIDVSEGALAVAKENAIANGVTVNFIQTDILSADNLPEQFDIIVSNPPYVRNLEKAEIKPNVLDFEPHLALFVEDTDPLIFYSKIAQLAKDNLMAGGKLYYEINQYLGSETVTLLEQTGFTNVLLRKDFVGNNRMISCGV